MFYHGRLGECQYIYMIKRTNELALNVSLVVSFTIHHNWHCLSKSCRIKHIKAVEKAMASRFLHRSEHWVGINSTISVNCKHSLDFHSNQSLGENGPFDIIKTPWCLSWTMIICYKAHLITENTTGEEGSRNVLFSLSSGMWFPSSNPNK